MQLTNVFANVSTGGSRTFVWGPGLAEGASIEAGAEGAGFGEGCPLRKKLFYFDKYDMNFIFFV